jgi:Sap-like sulfolipid-1-addressing protein
LTTTTLGVAIVFSLQSLNYSRTRAGVPPAVDLAAGLVLLVLAAVGRRGDREARPAEESPDRQRPWTERMLGRGTGRVAFLVGVVLNLVPGVVAVVGYSQIARLGVGAGTEVLLVVLFNLIMFTLVEAPLVGYLTVPDWTARHVYRLNAWLRSHGREAIAWTAAVAGIYLALRGLAGLL